MTNTLPQMTDPVTVPLGDLAVGDRVYRPNFGTTETVVAIVRIGRVRSRLEFASGASWTHSREYRMVRVVG